MDEAVASQSNAQLEHQRFTSLINSMTDGVIAIGENYNVLLYNASTLNILDINTSIEGKPIAEALRLFDKKGQAVDINAMISASKIPSLSRDYLLHYQDGSTANLYLSIAPVHLSYGQVGERGFILMLRDITREKSLEEERDEFISVVSHELRTPIAIAEGNVSNAEMIASKSGDLEEIKAALKEAHQQVMFLSDMINDLATLSRADRGKLAVDIKPINIHDLLNGLVSSYKPQADAKGLELKAEPDPEIGTLNSAELYVKEILQNFVTNAIKYTQSGSVAIKAKPLNGGVEFSVSDTGIGIAKGDQQKIFDKFFRSEDYRTRETKGTGLGLYITKKLANLIKARINIESELNKGSTFTLAVPDLQVR